MFRGYYDSPIGLMEVSADASRVLSVLFVEERETSNENDIVKEISLNIAEV